MSITTILTPADARAKFGNQTMTPTGLGWYGNVRVAYIGTFAWAI